MTMVGSQLLYRWRRCDNQLIGAHKNVNAKREQRRISNVPNVLLKYA